MGAQPYQVKCLLFLRPMPIHFLEFEKPIQELHEELQRLKGIHAKGKTDLSTAIRELEEKFVAGRNELYSNLSGWQKVQVSRHPDRPYTLFYAENTCTDFLEIHGDRAFRDDKAIVGVLAVAGAFLGAWVWWLKNRAKTRLQKSDEEIKEKNEARKKAIMVGCVGLIATLSGLIVTSCATSQTLSYSYPVPSNQDIGRLILEVVS